MFVATIVRNGKTTTLHISAETMPAAFDQIADLVPEDAKILSLVTSDLVIQIADESLA